MSNRRPRNPRLQDRDREIVAHVALFRLTTPQVLHQLFFADAERNAVTKVTSRLCELGFLEKHPLYGANQYFTLGRLGAKAHAVPLKRLGPLGPQALYAACGILEFCALADPPRRKLSVSEMSRHEHLRALVVSRKEKFQYYLDVENETTRLGCVWVDGGGTVDHVVKKIQQIVAAQQIIPLVAHYLREQKFVVAVVAPTPQKRQAIADALRLVKTTAVLRIEAAPTLVHLLPGPLL